MVKLPIKQWPFLHWIFAWRAAVTSIQDVGDLPRVIILGTGWGAMSFIKGIDTAKFKLTVVSPTNYFLFTPFLPSATNGTIEASHCIEPVRRVLQRYRKRADYYEAAADDIDFAHDQVVCIDMNKPPNHPSRGFRLSYDHLIISIGADNNTYNVEGVKEYAHSLKTLEDARIIKTHILKNFEQAALPSTSSEERKRLLHFVIVGGGPTGVEFAAELHDYVHDDLMNYFGEVCRNDLKISIIEGTDHVLNAFDREIAKYAEEKFRRNGVELMTGTTITRLTSDTMDLKDVKTTATYTQPYGLMVWATGITTRPCVKKFMSRIPEYQQHSRALSVDGFLTVRGCNNVYAIGDCSTIQCEKMEALLEKFWKMANLEDGCMTLGSFKQFVNDHRKEHVQLEFLGDQVELHFKEHDIDNNCKLDKGEFASLLKDMDAKITALPATAQVASQQGAYLAHRLNHLGDPKFNLKPFAYDHKGNFAYVGENEVVYSSEVINLKGGAAFWGRNAAYLSKLFSWESKRNIMWDLFWSKWFGRDISHT